MTLDELNGHLELLENLAVAREAYETAQARILGAMQYDGMPHNSEPSRRPENLSAYLERAAAEVERWEKVVRGSEKRIRAFVETIPEPRTKSIFELRYLCGMKWEAVAAYIGGAGTYDSVRKACYRYLEQTNGTD